MGRTRTLEIKFMRGLTPMWLFVRNSNISANSRPNQIGGKSNLIMTQWSWWQWLKTSGWKSGATESWKGGSQTGLTRLCGKFIHLYKMWIHRIENICRIIRNIPTMSPKIWEIKNYGSGCWFMRDQTRIGTLGTGPIWLLSQIFVCWEKQILFHSVRYLYTNFSPENAELPVLRM